VPEIDSLNSNIGSNEEESISKGLDGSVTNWLRFVHIAAENGNESIVVECLLCFLRDTGLKNGGMGQKNLVASILDRHRRTVLHSACLGLQLNVVRLLLGYTVKVQFFGWGNRLEDLKKILKICQQADGTVTNEDFSSHIDPFCDIRLPPSLTFQPFHFSNLTMLDCFGNSPMLCACSIDLDPDFSKAQGKSTAIPQRGKLQMKLSDKAGILKVLLEVGDSPGLPNKHSKWTPLHWAAYYGDIESCCILLGQSNLCCDERFIYCSP